MIDYTIDRTQRLIRIQFNGWYSNTDVDLIRVFSMLFKDPGFDRTFNTLFLISVEASLSYALIYRPTNKLLEGMAAHQEGSKWAFVGPNQTALELLQEAMGSLDLKSVQWQLYDNEACALQWLNSTVDFNPSPGMKTRDERFPSEGHET